MKSFANENRTAARAAIPCRMLGTCAALALGCLLPAAPLLAQSPAPAPAVAPVPTPPADSRPETVISSDELDMVGGDDANHFYFRGNVKVQATNMIATADELEVISARQNSKGEGAGSADTGKGADASPATSASRSGASADAAAPNIGSIREIIMRGNVVISQEGRRATAGIAYLYPQEGRVVLADNPKVTDAQGTLSGWRMELYRGERKVRILSNPDEKQRTRVTLPALQDLGYSELGDSTTAAASAPAAEGGDTASQPAPASGSGQSTTAQSSAAPATSASAATASPAPATVSGQSAGAASQAAAPAAGSSAPTKTEETAEPASRERSGGWNPVNSRRR